jgi:hypothetical protein
MEEKARLYAAMKRGDYVAQEGEAAPLVDFDRKWAERHPSDRDSSSGSESEASSNNDTEVIEYEDEFGRVRRGTAAEKARMERRIARGQASAVELEVMSARPRAPEGVIYGDAVQTEAFTTADGGERMAELAARRDRSATPPDMLHYDASREIRTKGVGFYQFSKTEDDRTREMESLKKEREETERMRREREDERQKRKRELEERRKAIGDRRREMGEKKAKRLADDFLDGLEKVMAGDDSREVD